LKLKNFKGGTNPKSKKKGGTKAKTQTLSKNNNINDENIQFSFLQKGRHRNQN
jgi:hypothetical protein